LDRQGKAHRREIALPAPVVAAVQFIGSLLGLEAMPRCRRPRICSAMPNRWSWVRAAGTFGLRVYLAAMAAANLQRVFETCGCDEQPALEQGIGARRLRWHQVFFVVTINTNEACPVAQFICCGRVS
jgi:hypothetical protein